MVWDDLSMIASEIYDIISSVPIASLLAPSHSHIKVEPAVKGYAANSIACCWVGHYILSHALLSTLQVGLPDDTASVVSVSASEMSYVSRSTAMTGTTSTPVLVRRRAHSRPLQLVPPPPVCVPEVQEKTHTKR